MTKLAKWKTTLQMVAIAVLFVQGLFEHYVGMLSYGMGAQIFADVLAGNIEDEFGLGWKYQGMLATFYGGVGLMWLAALLTVVTGWDYFSKSLPYLHEEESND